MVRMTNLGRFLVLFCSSFLSSLLVVASILGGWGIPLVSSQGMVSGHIGSMATSRPAPEDPAWKTVGAHDAPAQRPGHYPSCLA